MPRTNVVVTPTGSGVAVDAVQTSLDTDIRQVVVIGDPDIDANILAVDASGHVGVTQSTSPWIVQGLQSTLASGTITTAGSVVTVTTAANYNLATVGIFGVYNGVTALFEGSPDGTNWFALQGQRTDTGVAETGPTSLTNTIRAWDIFIGAWTQFRVRATAWTGGTANVLITMQSMPSEPVPTVVQGPAGALANFWPVRHTDGTNQMPSADAAARALYARITDGTNANTVRAASTPATVTDTAQVVTQRPETSGVPQVTTASTNAQNLKASAGVYHGLIAVNTTATLVYLKVFDKATAATLGTDVPILNIPIPANTAGAGVSFALAAGRACTLGIQCNVTGGIANLDATNAVVGVVLNHLFL